MPVDQRTLDAFSPEACYEVIKTKVDAALKDNHRLTASPEVDELVLKPVATAMSQMAVALLNIIEQQLPASKQEPSIAVTTRLEVATEKLETLLTRVRGPIDL